MANKYKNEKIIKLGDVEILLRPTFENLAAFESNVFTLDEFMVRLVKGKLPRLSDLVRCIYFFQAEKKFNLEQVNELVMNTTGIQISTQVLPFISKCVGGYENSKDIELELNTKLSEAEKKS